MAGDAHVPRRLSRTSALLLAAAVGAACGNPPRTPPGASQSAPPATPAANTARESRRDTPTPEPTDTGIAAALDKAAWARVRWPGGDVIEAHQLDRLAEPIHAGSIFKLVVARASVEHGHVGADLRLACPRRIVTHGRRVDCVHTDLGRPLSLEDAIAHSCNYFFARLAERLDRDRLADTLRRVSAGEVTTLGDGPLPLVALGLEGPRLPLRSWLRVAVGATARDEAEGEAFAMLRRGAARAASEGSASALSDPTLLTFAKTGTTLAAQGRQEGLVVAWRPELSEAVVVRAAGGAGRDAARIASEVWERAAAARERRVRVGRVRDVSVQARRGTRIDDLPLEAYVAGVVAAEGEPGVPTRALEALAVLTRSYAAAPDGRHARDGYDVCDTTHCQVLGAATAWSRAATGRTRGLVLSRGGRVVAAPYSASCSGSLTDPADVWGGTAAVPTTVGADPGRHEVSLWASDVTADDLLAVLRAHGHRGDVLRGVHVVERDGSGLPARLALEGLAPTEIDATTFRHLVGRALGWDVLKSHAWSVSRTARGYRFTGRGKGHGAGLCVRGASVLASRGDGLAQILAAYVPGGRLLALQDDVRLRVPAPLAAQASTIREVARTLLADLRQSLVVSAPREVAIHVHPTRQAYQRSTGRAWWTSASTRPLGAGQYRVDVAPPEGREAAARLLPTLRHELVHVLTHTALAEEPLWMGEGLARAVGRAPGRSMSAARGAVRCPTDAEIASPGGQEAMQDAYTRAEACVARALPDGVGGWRVLGQR